MSNSYKRFLTSLTNGSPATVLTVPAATTAIVKSILVSNSNASSTTATVSISPAGVGSHVVIPAASISAEEYFDFLGGWDGNSRVLVLEAGDLLKIKVTTTDVVATVSALLIDRT